MGATSTRHHLLLAALLVSGCAAASFPSSLSAKASRRLRGGFGDIYDLEEDEADEELLHPAEQRAAAAASGERPEPRALSKEEITEKLNEVPVFCIVNEDGGVIGMKKADAPPDAPPTIMWYTDALEARALLKVAQEAHTDTPLEIACHGLGMVFEQCNGWGVGTSRTNAKASTTGADVKAQFVLQGSHRLVEETSPQLEKLFKNQGIDPGLWKLPVFMCKEMQSTAIVPVFLTPVELAKTWEKAGGTSENMPEELSVMDIRMLVAEMQVDSSPWRLIHFVNSQETIELAMEIEKRNSEKAA
jgi:hypothetical protein